MAFGGSLVDLIALNFSFINKMTAYNTCHASHSWAETVNEIKIEKVFPWEKFHYKHLLTQGKTLWKFLSCIIKNMVITNEVMHDFNFLFLQQSG